MEELLSNFPHALAIRDYKGGKEIRVQDLEHSLSIAQNFIKSNSLNIEIFEKDVKLRSFSVRNIE